MTVPVRGKQAGGHGRYGEAGSTRFYLQVLDLTDLDHLDLVAAEVAPQL